MEVSRATKKGETVLGAEGSTDLVFGDGQEMERIKDT